MNDLERKFEEPLRPYLGLSEIGHECERFLWYSFRWCFKNILTERRKRVMRRGRDEEGRIVNNLKKEHITVYADQLEISLFDGHVKGHIDGVCIDVLNGYKSYLLEMKLLAEKYFKKYEQSGVQVTNIQYYAQMQTYMHQLKLPKALFIVVNKNDDNEYREFVDLDTKYAESMFDKARYIISSGKIPERRPEFSRTHFKCKYWCSAYDICHNNLTFESNCRTCQNSGLYSNGNWICHYYDLILVPEQQRIYCKNYKKNFLP